jgi:hypothetical protein
MCAAGSQSPTAAEGFTHDYVTVTKLLGETAVPESPSCGAEWWNMRAVGRVVKQAGVVLGGPFIAGLVNAQ